MHCFCEGVFLEGVHCYMRGVHCYMGCALLLGVNNDNIVIIVLPNFAERL